MNKREQRLKLEQLNQTKEDLDKTIATMKEKNYPVEEIQKFTRQRFQVWNEIYNIQKGTK